MAALAGGALLALTPAAALIFRFNNPDALLVLLMTAAAYAVARSIDTDVRPATTRWLPAAAALTALLRSAGTTWSAATVGAQRSGRSELASGTSVIAIGGFSGGDDAPIPAQFQRWAGDRKVGHFATSADGHRHRPGGDRGTAAEITSWVKALPRHDLRRLPRSTTCGPSVDH